MERERESRSTGGIVILRLVRRRLGRDRKALVPVLEFILVFVIFLFIMSTFYTTISTQFEKSDSQDVLNRNKAIEVSNTLITETGMLSDGDRNWERYSGEDINYAHDHVVIIGLARDSDGSGILSYDKMLGLHYLEQATVRNVFVMDTDQLCNVTMVEYDTQDVAFEWGGMTTAGSEHIASVNRIVQVDMGEGELATMVMTVRVFNGGEIPESSSATSQIIYNNDMVPGAPTGLTATAGVGSVTLAWNVPANQGGSAVTSYKVYRVAVVTGQPYNGGESPYMTVNSLTYIDTSVTSANTYYYKVTASNSYGEGPKSDKAWATPLPTVDVPTQPLNLVATAGNGIVALSWSAPSSDGGSAILTYRIYRSTTSGTESQYDIVNYPTSSYTDGTLAPLVNGQTYYYQVSAVNANGEGPRSTEVFATPLAGAGTIPSAPQNLRATAGVNSVSLQWNPPISDGGSPIIEYRVYRGTTLGGETFLASAGTFTSYTDTAVTAGTTYYYYAKAVNSVGEGPQSNEMSATPYSSGGSPPTAPTNLRYLKQGPTSIRLTWGPPTSDGGSPITEFQVFRKQGTMGSYSKIATVSGSTYQYTDNYNFVSGFTYYYYVVAVNAYGQAQSSTIFIRM